MFNHRAILKKIDATRYQIVSNLAYENDTLSVIVKDGFYTDGASIPKALWNIVGSPFEGNYTEPAIIHDGLYGSHWLTKEESDKLFLEMMKVNGVSWLKRYTMYYAVKWFGNGAWNKPQKKIEKVKTLVELKRK